MVKHTQKIRRQQPTNCLSVFGHFVGLARKGLMLALRERLVISLLILSKFKKIPKKVFTVDQHFFLKNHLFLVKSL